jgi:hypothetical protein
MCQAAKAKAKRRARPQMVDRTFVERHFGNILDFRLRQKHVLGHADPVTQPTRLVQAGSP